MLQILHYYVRSHCWVWKRKGQTVWTLYSRCYNQLEKWNYCSCQWCKKNNTRYFKLELEYVGPAITLLAGKYCSKNSCSTNNTTITSDLYTLLTDGVKSTQGDYDAILIAKSDRYLKFSVAKPITITFSSGHYSDGGGSSGKTARFYKLDSDNQEVLYTSFTQQNDTQDYATEHFDIGTYVVRAASNYVTFSEWTIVED